MVVVDLNIPSYISHQPPSNYENRLLSVHPKLVHGIDNAHQCLNSLGLFPNHGLVHLELDAVVVAVGLQLPPVEVENVEVHDGQAPLPPIVALGQLAIFDVEDAVEELKVVLDLFVAAHGEAPGCGLDGCLHVGHFGAGVQVECTKDS